MISHRMLYEDVTCYWFECDCYEGIPEGLKNRFYWVRVEGVTGQTRLLLADLSKGADPSFLVFINCMVESWRMDAS